MSKKEIVLNHYTSVLHSLRQLVDENGQIYLSWPDAQGGAPYNTPTHITIVEDGVEVSKRLVMPTDKAMSANEAGVIFFHPLSELIIRGESEVLKCLRNMVRWRINATALSVMEIITELATAEDHKKMNAQQQVVLKVFANATKKIDRDIRQVLDRYLDKITGVYLKRKHTIDGDTYRRVASITFPLRAMIKPDSKMVGEYEMSSLKNVGVLASLIDYMFPNNDDPVMWSAGSNSNAAPYYESLLLVYCHVAERLNKVIKLFKKHIPNADELLIPIDFKAGLQNLDEWKLVMRPLDHNIGAVLKGEKETPVEQVTPEKINIAQHANQAATTKVNVTTPVVNNTNPVAANLPPVVNQPQQAQAPAPTSSGGGKSWQDIKASNGVPSNAMPNYNTNTMMPTGMPQAAYNPNTMMGGMPMMGGMMPMNNMGMGGMPMMGGMMPNMPNMMNMMPSQPTLMTSAYGNQNNHMSMYGSL